MLGVLKINYLGSCGHLTSFYCVPNCLGSVCMHSDAKTGELLFSLSLNSYGEGRENINRKQIISTSDMSPVKSVVMRSTEE